MKISIQFIILVFLTLPTFARESLFNDPSPIQFTLRAPFQELFRQRSSPMTRPPPGFVPVIVDSELSYQDYNGRLIVLHPKLKMRGNSSQDKSECLFPKIKMDFSPNEVRGTIFENQPTVGIGSHCSNQGGRSHLGRNWDGKTPHREVLAYEILRILKIPSYRARAAWFNYIEDSTGRSVDGNVEAMLLEDMDSMHNRYGTTKTEPYQSLRHSPGVTVEDVARIYFAEILLGNWDWYLKMAPTSSEPISKKFWNMKSMQTPSGQWIIFPYDFDLSSVVTLREYPSSKAKEIPTLFPRVLRQQVADEMKSHETEIRALGSRLDHDASGQSFFKKQVDRYYKKLPEFTK
ncbi:MAG: hypothetical protein H7061_06875 [Bdellovibrionaceae bacterium]|nr:hypothetical protein [Bdellovibrio sp.]